jgi:tetratricopeptide (TPR) repeat protein
LRISERARAIELLEDRFKRFGARSLNPARTLFWAQSQIGDSRRALQVLDEALAARPSDSELLLFAADSFARFGMFERADELTERAHGQSPESAWLRACAGIASYRNAPAEALALWRKIIEHDPLALDANHWVALLLAQTEGREQARAFLEEAVNRFPHNYVLQQMLAEWLRDDSASAEIALRRMIRIEPADAWARANSLQRSNVSSVFDEAFDQARLAREIEPSNPYSCCVEGNLYLASHWHAEAQAAYREAIRLSADTEIAITQLLAACRTPQEQLDALAFIEAELTTQTVFGDGLLAYREQARGILEADKLLASLRSALARRSDLWQAWSAVIAPTRRDATS